jgi:ribosomal protein S18 acetylase RimI-like enzyme
MTDYSSKRASDYSLREVAAFVTRSFEGYFVPVVMSEANLLARLRLDSVDPVESRILLAGNGVAGAALIARRGWTSRVAAMGIVPEWRNKGAGRFLLDSLLEDARLRGDREMVLEVIVQNEAAVHLYESAGFKKVRRLVGLSLEQSNAGDWDGLEEIDIRELGGLIARHGLSDLPWQLSAETIAQFTPPFRAYRLADAYTMISDPEASDVRFYSLLMEPELPGAASATRLIRATLARHPGRRWHVPAIFPEETVAPFEAAGFQRETLAQWQMQLDFPH